MTARGHLTAAGMYAVIVVTVAIFGDLGTWGGGFFTGMGFAHLLQWSRERFPEVAS